MTKFQVVVGLVVTEFVLDEDDASSGPAWLCSSAEGGGGVWRAARGEVSEGETSAVHSLAVFCNGASY